MICPKIIQKIENRCLLFHTMPSQYPGLRFTRFSGIVISMTDMIHDRLKQIRKTLKLSIREFSKEIYFSHSLYGQVEYGNREPTDRIIQLICSRFNVNKDWIRTGEGEMFTSSPPDIRLEKILEIYNIVDETLKDCLLEQSKILLKIYKDRKD
jgi:transcriptional regulator with XRE-family HTH domain